MTRPSTKHGHCQTPGHGLAPQPALRTLKPAIVNQSADGKTGKLLRGGEARLCASGRSWFTRRRASSGANQGSATHCTYLNGFGEDARHPPCLPRVAELFRSAPPRITHIIADSSGTCNLTRLQNKDAHCNHPQ